MCCFSGKVQSVSGTRIFARSAGKGRQYLVYAMSVSAPADLSMILPLPVPDKTAEDGVRFIDLKGYPKFFDALERGFQPPPTGSAKEAMPAARSAPTMSFVAARSSGPRVSREVAGSGTASSGRTAPATTARPLMSISAGKMDLNVLSARYI